MSNAIVPALPLTVPAAPPLAISGRVRNAATGYPLPGLQVQVLYVEPPSAPGATPPAPRVLGSARSDAAGSWSIVWDVGPAVSQLVCLLANCGEAQFEVSVIDKPGTSPLLVTEPASAARPAIVLNLAVPILPRPLTKTQWNDLGHRVRKAGPVTLSTVVDQLAQSGAATPIFRDWPLSQRQNALAALETGFLDPQGTLGTIAPVPSWQSLAAPGGLDAYRETLGGAGHRKPAQTALTEMSQKLAAFPSLSAVDWLIEPTLFGRDPAGAITANQGHYFGPSTKPWPWPVLQTPEMGYRDYLRTQWTSMIALVVHAQPHLTEAQAEQQLRNRFHQDFNVTSSTQVAANEVLIPILTEILTSPAGNTFGFGVAAGSIPARGTATARAYLNTLIGISGHSAAELTLRYRTDFTRPDGALSSQVWENIHTLQGFFRDSFQSIVDPDHTGPDVLGQPIIPDVMQGRAPWFLEYDEWLLQQQPIPFENYVQIREIFQMTIGAENRTVLANFALSGNLFAARAKFWVKALAINDALQQAFASFDQGEYKIALDAYNSLVGPLETLLNDPIVTAEDIAGDFATRRALKIASLDDLNKMLATWQVGDYFYSGQAGDNAIDKYFTDNIPRLVPSLIYLAQFSLPTFIAQATIALGNWADALRPFGRAAFFLVGKATISDQDNAAWRDRWGNEWNDFPLYSAGNMPYTVDTRQPLPQYPSLSDDDPTKWGAGIKDSTRLSTLLDSLVPKGLHPVEAAFYRLQMGDAMLGWADKLYRTDQAASISRARELYKGIYYLHGSVPPINPSWTSGPLGGFFPSYVNPAKAAQLARGRLGFTQIQAGLNFFGFADDMTPSLRYSTLKPAADAFAAGAKSAERDFLTAMSQIESATVDNMKNNAMFRRANLQVQIAQQQAGIAGDQVIQANALIGQVNFQIAQLKMQIADHDSYFGQLGDYLSGMASEVKGAGSVLTETKTAGTALGADTSGLALSGGAGIMAGFAAFAVFSYVTMSSMADAANLRDAQLHNLEAFNLAAANAQLDIAQRNSTIAGLMQQVAQSDADLATSLLAFAQERYLNIEFWSYTAGLFKRLMRQYLDLAARFGWLAQQALVYEQRAPMSIIGFDYFPEQYQGAGGADQLQLDLANLEAQHLNGLHEMVPIKYTYSLSRDFPLQFAQLQKAGTCLFQTSDAALRVAFPGTYGYRIIAATPKLVRSGTGAPMYGLLTNSGVSQISGSDGTLQLSVRPADGLPITEFDISSNANVFGLPGTTLMQFEGGGIETTWQFELPVAANPGGFAGLADAVVTFFLRARFAPSLYQSMTSSTVAAMSKIMMFSALRLKVVGLADLQGHPSVARLDFDLTSVGLPALEKTRKLSNLFFVLVSSLGNSSVKADVIAATPAKTINLTLDGGVVYSNSPPIADPLSTAPLSPLNVLAGIDVNQMLSLRIDKTANAGIDFTKVSDVILGVDYTATF
jgi:Tc toxin complex TcA C-terminal TcB-binding domain